MIAIHGLNERLAPIKARLSDTIHGCMMSVLGMPQDKRSHRFIVLAKDDFYYPTGRTDAYLFIEINKMAGPPAGNAEAPDQGV